MSSKLVVFCKILLTIYYSGVGLLYGAASRWMVEASRTGNADRIVGSMPASPFNQEQPCINTDSCTKGEQGT